MKSIAVRPGEFVRPAGAQLRSAPDEQAVVKVWEKAGACLAYPKADGWRIQVHKIGASVKLFSRTGKDYTRVYPSIVQMIRKHIEDELAILDTELVGFDQNGCHLAPAKLRSASQFRCYLLDALYLKGRDLTSLPVQERVAFIQEHLHEAFHGMFTFAEYTFIQSQNDLIRFYQACLARREEGFDGAIIKQLNTPYFTDVLKVKPEDTVDAVVVGAYLNDKRTEKSLLLAVPSHKHHRWIPIAKVFRTSIDWDIVWPECQLHILDNRPHNLVNLDRLDSLPDIWIAPEVVVTVAVRELQTGKSYLVHAEAAKKCTLREDKGPDEATSFEQVLQLAGLPQNTEILSDKSQQMQPRLFEEHADAAEINVPQKDEGLEQVLRLASQSEKPRQLQLSFC